MKTYPKRDLGPMGAASSAYLEAKSPASAFWDDSGPVLDPPLLGFALEGSRGWVDGWSLYPRTPFGFGTIHATLGAIDPDTSIEPDEATWRIAEGRIDCRRIDPYILLGLVEVDESVVATRGVLSGSHYSEHGILPQARETLVQVDETSRSRVLRKSDNHTLLGGPAFPIVQRISNALCCNIPVVCYMWCLSRFSS